MQLGTPAKVPPRRTSGVQGETSVVRLPLGTDPSLDRSRRKVPHDSDFGKASQSGGWGSAPIETGSPDIGKNHPPARTEPARRGPEKPTAGKRTGLPNEPKPNDLCDSQKTLAAKSRAAGDLTPTIAPALVGVIEAWARLPGTIREAIATLVRASRLFKMCLPQSRNMKA